LRADPRSDRRPHQATSGGKPSVDQERRERGTRSGQRTGQLRTGEREVSPELSTLKDQIAAIVGGLTGAAEDLQGTSWEIHPAILSRGGLGPALKPLARRCTVPVDVQFDVEQRLPESAEVARIEISSPAGNGTSLQATIPFDPAVGQVPPPA
jgi:hypothetical protein